MSVISDLSQILNSITNEQSKVHRYCWVLHKKINLIVISYLEQKKFLSEINFKECSFKKWTLDSFKIGRED